MASSEITIDDLAGVGSDGFESISRKKRKSGMHRPVERQYMSTREWHGLRMSGGVDHQTGNLLEEFFADRARPRYEEGIVACVNQDYDVVTVDVNPAERTATIYPDNCVGNITEFKYAQKLGDAGFRCTAVKEIVKKKKSKRLMLVETDPAQKTATVYAFNFADPDKARLWNAALTGIGYDVKVNDY